MKGFILHLTFPAFAHEHEHSMVTFSSLRLGIGHLTSFDVTVKYLHYTYYMYYNNHRRI